MSDTNNQYIKFMSDIIDSGLWGRLSPAAKTLYPVLLKFSDQNFKHVWPSTETLLKLTGFRTKKSIASGKKELMKEGLLQYKPGSGRTNSTYFFSFNYEMSKVNPLWDKNIPRRGLTKNPLACDLTTTQHTADSPLNNLNITINNTQSNEQKPPRDEISLDNLMTVYDFSLIESALQIAKIKGFEGNISYISGVCKNLAKNACRKEPNFNQNTDTAQHVIDSWRSFLDWSKCHLTRSSTDILEKISVDVDGQSIFIQHNLSEFLKQIIRKYFNEEISPSILIVFSETDKNMYR